MSQLRTRKETAEQFAEGVHRFMVGLGKKVLLANNAGVLWDSIRAYGPCTELPVADRHGWDWQPIRFSFILTSLPIRIWRSALEKCSASISWRISTIHIFLRALRNSGEDGTFRLVPGSGIMCIFHSEEIESGVWKHIRNILVVWMLTGIWHGASWNFVAMGRLLWYIAVDWKSLCLENI